MMKIVLLLVLIALVNAGWNTFNFDKIEKKAAHFVHMNAADVKLVRKAAEMDAVKKPPAKKPPVKSPVKAPVKSPVKSPVKAPVKAPTSPAPAPVYQVAYQEIYKGNTCGTTNTTNALPFYISGNVLNVCGRSDNGKKAEMLIMKTATELGTNTYSGNTCTGTFTYKKEVDLRTMKGCMPASTLGGPSDYSFKAIKSTLTAFLQKYSSINGVFTLNYATKTCSGQYPTIDVYVYDRCTAYTSGEDNTTTAGYLTMNFTPTGATQIMYGPNNQDCTGTPLYTYNVTYADMNYGKCTPTDDSEDNYMYNIQTTRFLMK